MAAQSDQCHDRQWRHQHRRSAFCSCSSLTSVTVPGSVTNIGDDAFDDCASLTNATIANSVNSIGKYSF